MTIWPCAKMRSARCATGRGIAMLTLFLSIALTGCAPAPLVPPEAANPSTTPPATPVVTSPAAEATMTQTPPATGQATAVMPTPRPKVGPLTGTTLEAQARLDLAGRLGVLPAEIKVVSIQKTEMPTGSLGCGGTGDEANPGIIIGDEITLQAGGLEYTYRSDGQRLVPCSPAAFPGGRGPMWAAGSGPAQLQAQDRTVTDLSKKLGIAKNAVSVVEVESVEWPDASLGCPQPGAMYAQVITPGFRIVLEANGRRYEYHTGESAVTLCAVQPLPTANE